MDLSTTSAQPNDVVQCSITAPDGVGEQAISSATVSVENDPPEVTSVLVNPIQPINTDLTAVVGHSTGRDSVTLTYTWNVNGRHSAEAATPLRALCFPK